MSIDLTKCSAEDAVKKLTFTITPLRTYDDVLCCGADVQYPNVEGLFDVIGQAFDPENDKHVEVALSFERLRQAEIAKMNADLAERRKRLIDVRQYLTAAGIDASLLDDTALLKIYHGFPPNAKESEDSTPEDLALRYDDELECYVTEDGELVGYAATGNSNVSVEKILESAGDRLTYYNAKLEALKAAKQVYLDRAAAAYDSKIKKFDRSIEWLKKGYTPLAESHMVALNAPIVAENKRLIEAGKKPKPLISSLHLGLLEIKYTATKESVVVEDEAVAVQALRALYKDKDGPFYDAKLNETLAQHEAFMAAAYPVVAEIESWVNAAEKVAKSMIPAEVKEALDVPGLYWKPGGDRQCTIS